MLELNTIYNSDCLEGMEQLPDNSINVIITSPPYNLGETHHTGGKRFKAYNMFSDNMPEPEYQNWQLKILNECYRILKPDGVMFYNHKNRIKKGVQISPYEWLTKSDLYIKQELVWFNGSQNFDKIRFYPMTERIYWLSKKPDTTIYNTINHHDLFDWQPEGTDKKHKRAFPLKMAKELLSCVKTKGVVLDPFMGSGTVAVAAYDMGFEYLGFEIDKDYYTSAQERIETFKAQMNMFDII